MDTPSVPWDFPFPLFVVSAGSNTSASAPGNKTIINSRHEEEEETHINIGHGCLGVAEVETLGLGGGGRPGSAGLRLLGLRRGGAGGREAARGLGRRQQGRDGGHRVRAGRGDVQAGCPGRVDQRGGTRDGGLPFSSSTSISTTSNPSSSCPLLFPIPLPVIIHLEALDVFHFEDVLIVWLLTGFVFLTLTGIVGSIVAGGTPITKLSFKLRTEDRS